MHWNSLPVAIRAVCLCRKEGLGNRGGLKLLILTYLSVAFFRLLRFLCLTFPFIFSFPFLHPSWPSVCPILRAKYLIEFLCCPFSYHSILAIYFNFGKSSSLFCSHFIFIHFFFSFANATKSNHSKLFVSRFVILSLPLSPTSVPSAYRYPRGPLIT